MVTSTIEIDEELYTEDVLQFIVESKECINLYSKKNHDYGNSFDKGMDVIGEAYGIGRIYDKVNRLVTLINPKQTQQVKDESIDDTLRDLACYSIMMLKYRTKQRENEQSKINFE